MSRFFSAYTKPENALKRADELLFVGQKNAALQALHDVITSKRHRTWQKSLEQVMMKFVELCVESRKGRLAKEGLIQYRIVCQQVNVSSLEDVIKHLLKLATAKAEAARAASAAASDLSGVEDLDAENTPENLMLGYVSAEKGRDRADRELVTPSFKFLWETYRSVLEILRNNSKLEALYAMTAMRAFQFCKEYQRTTEFRRLAEMLRNHLVNLNKYRDQRDRPDLSLPETLQLYLETRFEQLKVATELQLWQEAFRSVEDIHGLVMMVKKSPKPQMMAVYYAKLTKVFWVSENHLYHAYAWFKLFNLSKTYNKNLSPADTRTMASITLLATIAVAPYDTKGGANHIEQEIEKERNLKMANLLGFTLDPKRDTREVLSRSQLLGELTSKGFLQMALPEVRELYQLLETQFHPLDFCQRALSLIDKVKALPSTLSASCPVTEVEWSEYVASLERVVVLRFLQQVSSVYSTIKLDTVRKLVTFKTPVEVEKIVMDAVRCGFLAARIDHCRGCLTFGSRVLESESVKQHITVLSKRLSQAVALINPRAQAPKAGVSADVIAAVDQEHKLALARKVYIERRKEEQERILLEQEREEEAKKQQILRQSEEAEAKRLEEERRSREEDRIRRDIEEREHEEALALLEAQQKKKGKKGKGPVVDENTKLDKRQLMEDALQEQIKERQEAEKKLQRLAKQLDHLERAKREEEAPLLAQAYEDQKVSDREYHEETQKQMLAAHRAQWEKDLEEKRRTAKMMDDQAAFAARVSARREEEFRAASAEREERIAEERAMRAAERVQRRKQALLARLKTEEAGIKAEEKRREAEAEKARQAEAEEMRKKELASLREREAEERKERMRLEAERQKEADERQRQQREGGGGAGGGGGGGDRYQPRGREGAAAPAAPPAGGRYVPRHLQGREGGAAPPAGGDRYQPRGGGGDRWAGGAGGDSSEDRRYPPRREDGDRPPPPSGGGYRPPAARGSGGW